MDLDLQSPLIEDSLFNVSDCLEDRSVPSSLLSNLPTAKNLNLIEGLSLWGVSTEMFLSKLIDKMITNKFTLITDETLAEWIAECIDSNAPTENDDY